MKSEHGTGEHVGSREGKNPLQMRLFDGGSHDQPGSPKPALAHCVAHRELKPAKLQGERSERGSPEDRHGSEHATGLLPSRAAGASIPLSDIRLLKEVDYLLSAALRLILE